MKCTIVVTTYNSEKYITGALNSALNQNYYDYDILIVDDGSTDKTLDIVREFQQTNTNIKLLQIPHAGGAFALKMGIENASGEIITVLDSDDLLMEHSLDTGCTLFKRNENLGYVWTQFKYLLPNNTFKEGISEPVPDDLDFKTALARGWWKASRQRFIRKSFYDKTSGLDGKIKRASDFQLCCLLSTTTCDFEFTPIITYIYRKNPDGVTGKHRPEQAMCYQMLLRKYFPKGRPIDPLTNPQRMV